MSVEEGDVASQLFEHQSAGLLALAEIQIFTYYPLLTRKVLEAV